jgi:translation initiation factor 2B subunit (eIF-2B alpha/beta/delta family)
MNFRQAARPRLICFEIATTEGRPKEEGTKLARRLSRISVVGEAYYCVLDPLGGRSHLPRHASTLELQ